jgi:hypothetical protein
MTMDRQNYSERFTPTLEILDRAVEQSGEVAGDAGYPLYMLDHIGHPFFIDLGNGRDYELHPWVEIIDTLLVDDTKGRIHWMHPDMRSRLDGITEEFLLRVVPDQTKEGERAEDLARALYEDCLSRLAAYDARRKHIQPAVEFFAGPKRLASVKAAADAIEDLAVERNIEGQVIWRLAQILRRVPVIFEGANDSGASLFKASVLSQMIDPASCPKPDHDAAYTARLIVETERSANLCPEAIDTLARAIAHGILPLDPDDLRGTSDFVIDLLIQQIKMGQHDPSPGHGVPSSSMASHVGALICGQWPAEGGPISAHETIRLVGAANARLDVLGIEERLCPHAARARAERDREIPF